MKSLPAEYKNLCRGCFSEISATNTDTLNIFQIIVEQTNLSKMFMACTSINISLDDALPHLICSVCQTLLISSYEFQVKCINSNNKFHSILNNSSSIEENKSQNFWMPTDGMEIKIEQLDKPMKSRQDCKTENNCSYYNVRSSENEFKFKQNYEILVPQSSHSQSIKKQQKYNEKPFKCKKLHSKLHGCSDDVDFEPYKCKTCKCQFVSNELLTKHKCNHVNIKESIGTKYKCTFCEHIYLSHLEFIKHMIDQHDGTCIYSCWLCDQKFHSNSGLYAHLRTHPEQMPYLCQECGKTFTRPSNLRNHILLHTAEKRFKCDKCPKKFSTKGTLKCHLLTHSTEKPFECDLCRRAFHRKCILISHMYTHSGKRPLPFSCEVCGKRLKSDYSLKTHVRSHTGEKPFKCSFCTIAYSQKGDLNKHLRTHIGENTYKCKDCDETFRLKRDLTLHENNHYLGKVDKRKDKM